MNREKPVYLNLIKTNNIYENKKFGKPFRIVKEIVSQYYKMKVKEYRVFFKL